MKVSIQVNFLNGWDNNAPAIHDVKDWQEAVNICYALSHQFSNTTVRLCKVPDAWDGKVEWIGRLSGTYIQSREGNLPETVEWIDKIINK